MIYKTPNLQNAKTPSKLETPNNKIYKLEDRLQSFFERSAKLCKKINLNARTERTVSQFMASSGSVAANYAEASEAMSKKDFIKSIKIVRKEAKESLVWIKGLKIISGLENPEFDSLVQEAKEIIYIFTSILKKTDV